MGPCRGILVLLALVLVIDEISGQSPVIGTAGEDLILNCPYNGFPSHSITWKKEETTLPNSFSQEVLSNGTLMILKAQRSTDAGRYECSITKLNGEVTHHHLDVEILVPPKITPFWFQDELVREGLRARLQCVISEGDLPLHITWTKDQRPIQSNDLGIHIRPLDEFSSILTISSITPRHNGNYTCTASNKAATVSHTARLAVNVPPKIVPFHFQSSYYVEGSSARVVCGLSEGDIPVTFSWIKNGLPLSDNSRIHSFEGLSSILSFPKVSSSDSGNYTCVASNRVGTSKHSTELVVHVPPQWNTKPNDQAVLEGSNVYLHCSASGYPQPVIKWIRSKDGGRRNVVTVENDGRTLVYPNGSLVLQNMVHDMTGYYFCLAYNGIGRELSAMVHVRIHAPPQMKTQNEAISVAIRKRLDITCVGEGTQPITVQWEKNGKIIDGSNQRYRIETAAKGNDLVSTLIANEASNDDNGLYLCTESNAYGKNTSTFTVTVKQPPESPQNVRLTSVSSRTLELAWDKPFDGHDAIKKYTIQYKTESASWDDGSVTVGTGNGEITNAILANLQPASVYLVRMFAENQVGSSPSSQEIRVNVPEEAPSSPPVDVKADALDSETIKVTWKPPEPKTGTIDGYNIGYKQYDSPNPYSFKTFIALQSSQELTVTLNSLPSYTKYEIVVQAYNAQGTGPKSNPVYAITSEGVPNISPSEVRCTSLTSESIHITWSPIVGVMQYAVNYRHASPWLDGESRQKVSDGSSVTLTGLDKFMNYSISVSATSAHGSGPESDFIYCHTLDDKPSEPADIKPIPTSETSVFIAWKPPNQPNGILKSYTLYHKTSGSSDNPSVQSNIPATVNHYEVIGLKKKQLYDFWVTANTVSGEGNPSRVVVAEGSAGLQIAARIVSFGTKVRAAWKSVVYLPCQAIGAPQPTHQWLKKGVGVEYGDRYILQRDGSLRIDGLREEDSGEFGCLVTNAIGNDQITHTVVTQVPPSAPRLEITKIWNNGAQFRWDHKDNIRGYLLRIRREGDSWKEIRINPGTNKYTIDDLECGSRYQCYVSAYSDIGESDAPSPTIFTTNGTQPSFPLKSDLIEESTTSVSLSLNSWRSNGCQITSFIVEYRAVSQPWVLVSNNIKPEQRRLVISELRPGTRYRLRMAASNSAGTQHHEYDFATLQLDGGTVVPELMQSDEAERVRAYLGIWMFVSLAVTVILLLAILATACFYVKHKKAEAKQQRMSYQSHHMDSLNSFQQTYNTNTIMRRSNGIPDDVTIYSTISRVGPRTDDPFSGINNHRVSHGPILPMPVETTFIFPSQVQAPCTPKLYPNPLAENGSLI